MVCCLEARHDVVMSSFPNEVDSSIVPVIFHDLNDNIVGVCHVK